jgi:hypothetical protein
MNIDLAPAMRRALEHTRAQNLNEATAVIQAALAGHRPSRERPGSAGIPSSPASRAPFSLLDADTGNTSPLAANPVRRARLQPPSLVDPKAISTRGRNDSDGEAADLGLATNAAPSSRRIRRSLGVVVNALRHGRASSLAASLPGIGAPAAHVRRRSRMARSSWLARTPAERGAASTSSMYRPIGRTDHRGSSSCCTAARRAQTISQSAQA